MGVGCPLPAGVGGDVTRMGFAVKRESVIVEGVLWKHRCGGKKTVRCVVSCTLYIHFIYILYLYSLVFVVVVFFFLHSTIN